MRAEWAHKGNGSSKQTQGKARANAGFAHRAHRHAHANIAVTGQSADISSPIPNTPGKPKKTSSHTTGRSITSGVTLSPEETPKKHRAHTNVPAAMNEEEEVEFSAYDDHGHGVLLPEANMMGDFSYNAHNPGFFNVPGTYGGLRFQNGLTANGNHFPPTYNTQPMMGAHMSTTDYSSSNSSTLPDFTAHTATNIGMTAANMIAPTSPAMQMIPAHVQFAANQFNSHNNHHNGMDNFHDGSASDSYNYTDTAGVTPSMNDANFDSFDSQPALHATQSSSMSSASGSPTAEASDAFAQSMSDSFDSSSDGLVKQSEGMKIHDHEKPFDPMLYQQEEPDDVFADLGEYEHDEELAKELGLILGS
ncbi:hypothetical protein BDY17DRAFT_296122 [Neohortaea acidophila]|uniref:Uncharacterized protein n=1 Tax=Neohortaea acidophila TaxID=245834 RepID=A0A6A6PZS4_9PEZI|nr:uncharacterized protein BDY17DRAFT_296122 [Neohortaea acidophila]KAF2484677.1 hypothetical protein BDY17DRAFT_296122 [Neohortaea acidophila]